MSDENPKIPTADETVAQLEERLSKKREDRKKQETAQYAKDLAARDALEDEHGAVSGVKVPFRPGMPTRAYLRTPKSSEYKRYRDQIEKAVKNKGKTSEPGDLLAKACWVYPTESEDRDAMLEAFPGLLVSITIAAQKLAEGAEVDEGKD